MRIKRDTTRVKRVIVHGLAMGIAVALGFAVSMSVANVFLGFAWDTVAMSCLAVGAIAFVLAGAKAFMSVPFLKEDVLVVLGKTRGWMDREEISRGIEVLYGAEGSLFGTERSGAYVLLNHMVERGLIERRNRAMSARETELVGIAIHEYRLVPKA